ncbi:MAG: hypothetical protein K6U89_15395 [Chloroflexi bacterium]|nr:hypothetical protein [Chloroflexota bacterium]
MSWIYEAEDLPGAMLLKSGVETLDGCIGGLPVPDLVEILGLPGSGKTPLPLLWRPEVFIGVEASGRRKKLRKLGHGHRADVYAEGVEPIRDSALPPEAVEELSHVVKTARFLAGVPFVAGGSAFADDREMVLMGRCPR